MKFASMMKLRIRNIVSGTVPVSGAVEKVESNPSSAQAGDHEVEEQIPGSEVPGDDVIAEPEVAGNGPVVDDQPTVNSDLNFDEMTEEVSFCQCYVFVLFL